MKLACTPVFTSSLIRTIDVSVCPRVEPALQGSANLAMSRGQREQQKARKAMCTVIERAGELSRTSRNLCSSWPQQSRFPEVSPCPVLLPPPAARNCVILGFRLGQLICWLLAFLRTRWMLLRGVKILAEGFKLPVPDPHEICSTWSRKNSSYTLHE